MKGMNLFCQQSNEVFLIYCDRHAIKKFLEFENMVSQENKICSADSLTNSPVCDRDAKQDETISIIRKFHFESELHSPSSRLGRKWNVQSRAFMIRC